MKCCIDSGNFIRLLVLSMKLLIFKSKNVVAVIKLSVTCICTYICACTVYSLHIIIAIVLVEAI